MGTSYFLLILGKSQLLVSAGEEGLTIPMIHAHVNSIHSLWTSSSLYRKYSYLTLELRVQCSGKA